MRMTLRMLIGGITCTVVAALVWAEATSRPQGAATMPATTSAPATRPSKLSHAEMVKEFGITAGEPVGQGYVFFDGQYIDAPYTVSREGGRILINGRLISEFTHRPPGVRDDSDPGMPPNLTRESGFADLEYPGRNGDRWDKQKMRWLVSHYPLEEAAAKAVEYYQSLPFVKSASVDNAVAEVKTISVVTHSGKNHMVLLSHLLIDPPPTKQEVLTMLEAERMSLQAAVKEGDCLFFYSPGLRVQLGARTAGEVLPDVIATIQSDLAREDKVKKLKSLGVWPAGVDKYVSLLLDNFKGSPQLDARMAELRTAASQPAIEVSPLMTRPAPAMPQPKIYRAPAPTPPPTTPPAGGYQRIRIIPSTPDK